MNTTSAPIAGLVPCRQSIGRRTRNAILCLLILALTIGALSACGHSETTLMEWEGQTLSVNVMNLMLSRIKGNLAVGGYKVTNDSFWDTIALSDGTRYGEYIRQTALQDAKSYLIASVLFEQEGLSLSSEAIETIDQNIEELIEYHADGSKSTFNNILSAYGANIDTLRALCLLEAKTDALQKHLYGTDASKIADSVKQEYMEQSMVCFQQILFRSYYYVYEKDANGDDVYYVSEKNNGKVNNIAYDKKEGVPHKDENGKEVKDANGDVIYFHEDNRIAYDVKAGVRAYTYDSNGNIVTQSYTEQEIKEHKRRAQELWQEIMAADNPTIAFETMMDECAAEADDVILCSDSYGFLYTDSSNGDDYLNDMADALKDMDVGEVTLLSSDYGHSLLIKFLPESGAYKDSRYSEWFSAFNQRLIASMFRNLWQPYADKVTVDTDAFASVSDMKSIGVNYYY